MSKNEHSPVFNDLPLELISYIFEFITYSDRKEARRVCQKWYRASLDPLLLDNEMVTCPKDSSERFSSVMMASKRDIFHLTIREDQCLFYVEDFWNRFGPKLRSLALIHCKGSARRFFKIVRRCLNLRSFEIFHTLIVFRSNGLAYIICDVCRDNLINGSDTGKIRSNAPKLMNLHTLKISSSKESNAALFDKLVRYAPNLKNFALERCLETLTIRCVHGVWVIGRIKGLTCKHILSYFKKKSHRTFDLSLTYNKVDDYKAFIDLVTVPNVRLRKLTTDSSEAIVNSCSQKYLLELELENMDVDDQIFAEICKFEQLKHLSLSDHEVNLVVPSCVHRMSSLKNLTRLSLRGCEVEDADFVAGLCLEVNTIMKELTLIELPLVSQMSFVALAKTHPALVRLNLTDCDALTDWSAQSFFQYALCLRSLKLTRCKHVTDAGLSGLKLSCWNSTQWWTNRPRLYNPGEKNFPTGFPISRLKNLRALTVSDCKNVNGNFFKSGVSFPSIRVLNLNNVKMSTKAFRCLFENNPTIEVLELKKCKIHDKVLEVVLPKMKRLKEVKLTDRPAISVESINLLQKHNINVSFSSVIPIKVPSIILRDPPGERE